MTARRTEDMEPAQLPALIEVDSVTKVLGANEVFRDLSFHVWPHDCVALSGRNGSGKSTLLRLLVGLVRPDSGTARVLGTAFASGGVAARTIGTALGIADRGLQVRDVVSLRARAVGVSDPDVVESAIDDAGLAHATRKRLSQLSAGMFARTELAAAFLGRPTIVLLDEPFANLDDAGRAWAAAHIGAATARGGAVILSTHGDETLRVASRVIEMPSGREISGEDSREGEPE